MADARKEAVSVYVCQSGALVCLNVDDGRDSDASQERDLFEFVDIPAVSVYSHTTVKLPVIVETVYYLHSLHRYY